MPLKKAEGNMYPWVTHTHSHSAGECPHRCSYCYVGTSPRLKHCQRYKGEIRLIEKEFSVSYGSGKVIFIDNCIDLFANEYPPHFRKRILSHCGTWPENEYVFQTKNPADFVDIPFKIYGLRYLTLGITIETNRYYPTIMNHTPLPVQRTFPTGWHDFYKAMFKRAQSFITIEPILDFDPDIFLPMIINQRPDFVNIGADSKHNNLPEPSADKVKELIFRLVNAGIELRLKPNLKRLDPDLPWEVKP